MHIFLVSSAMFLLTLIASDIPQQIVNNQAGKMVAAKNTESPNIKVTQVTLLAREENTAPIGEPSTANRDIGFASVFIRLKNLKESDQKITIKNIKIVNVGNGKVQNFVSHPQEFVLRPLENAEHVFHFKNKTGYSGKDTVKAIVTYQIGNFVSQISSDSTQVIRP